MFIFHDANSWVALMEVSCWFKSRVKILTPSEPEYLVWNLQTACQHRPITENLRQLYLRTVCCHVTVVSNSLGARGLSHTRLPCPYYLPGFAQTHVHWVCDAIQPFHPLSPPFPPALNLSQHQGLFQWVGFLNQVAEILELQLQHQSFQWIFRVDFF